MYNIIVIIYNGFMMYTIVRFMVTVVLFPDPTLKEGKGSGELGPNGPALRNFHAPIRSQLWHSHMTSFTAGIQHRYSYSIMLTNWIQALHGPVGTHHSARTENLADVHKSRKPLFPP